MASSSHMEVVEDSEPERLELRRKLKEDRRRRRDANTKENHVITPNSDAVALQLSESKALSNGVIDISDDDTPHFQKGVHPLAEVPNAPPKQHEGTQSDSPPVEPHEPFGEDQPESGFKPAVLSKLNRFAYTAKTSNPPPRISQSLSRTPSTDLSKEHQPFPPSRSREPTAPAREGLGFPESDLSRLLKCISCDVKWTVRKSATQKLAHIKTCARKTHLSDETVKTLIQREITAPSMPVAAGPSKVREKEKRKVKDQASQDEPPKTFLEQVVLEDSAGQKKRRRKHGPETVQSVSETRGTILEKAKLLLQTRPLVPEIDSTLEPPMTQAFGKSNLGQPAFGAGVSSPRWNVVNGHNPGYPITEEYNECPPTTQAFGTSRLGRAMKQSPAHPCRQNTPSLSVDNVNPTAVISSVDYKGEDCRDDINGAFSHPHKLNFFPNSVCAESPPRHKVTNEPHDKQEQYLRQEYFEDDNENQWEDDDAVIHFDPDDYVSIGNLDSERFIATESLDVLRDDDNEVDIHGSRSRSLSNASSRPSQTNEIVQHPGRKFANKHSIEPPMTVPKSTEQHTQNKSRNEKRKAVRVSQDHGAADVTAPEEEINDRKLQVMLKKMILEDEPLHLRILHYEPIHFDVFMKMVEAHSIQSKSLKTKIRTFLDQQAISFYGYYAGRRVRR